jgi:hypothetical protein
VVFKSSRILPVFFEELVRTAAIEIKCTDIYGFLGRRYREVKCRDGTRQMKYASVKKTIYNPILQDGIPRK